MSPLDRIAQLTAQLELVAQSEADLREANRKLEREAQELRCQLVTARELTDRLSADVHRLAEEKREACKVLALANEAMHFATHVCVNNCTSAQREYVRHEDEDIFPRARAFLCRHANP